MTGLTTFEVTKDSRLRLAAMKAKDGIIAFVVLRVGVAGQERTFGGSKPKAEEPLLCGNAQQELPHLHVAGLQGCGDVSTLSSSCRSGAEAEPDGPVCTGRGRNDWGACGGWRRSCD